RGRPRTIVDLKTGVKNDGRITAVRARVVQDGGGYCSYGPVTILYSGALLGALYDIPNVQYDGYRVLTNKPVCGAMRGHGTVNVRFAFESQLDEICARLKLDAADVRRKNLLKPPCITVNGLRVLSYGLPEWVENSVQPLCEWSGEFDYQVGYAALDGEHQDRSRRRRGGLYGGCGDWTRFGHHDRTACRRGTWLLDGAREGDCGGYGSYAD